MIRPLALVAASAAALALAAPAQAGLPTHVVQLVAPAADGPRVLAAIERSSPTTVGVQLAATQLPVGKAHYLAVQPAGTTSAAARAVIALIPAVRRAGGIVTVAVDGADLGVAEARGGRLGLYEVGLGTDVAAVEAAIPAARADIAASIISPRDIDSGLPVARRATGMIAVQRTRLSGGRARVRATELLRTPTWTRVRVALARARCCSLLGAAGPLTGVAFMGSRPVEAQLLGNFEIQLIVAASVPRGAAARSLVLRDGASGRIGVQIPLA